MKENWEKFKIIKFINFLSIADNIQNCYTHIIYSKLLHTYATHKGTALQLLWASRHCLCINATFCCDFCSKKYLPRFYCNKNLS